MAHARTACGEMMTISHSNLIGCVTDNTHSQATRALLSSSRPAEVGRDVAREREEKIRLSYIIADWDP